MGIQFPVAPLHGVQYTPPGIPVTWQYDMGRNAWRVVRGGTPWTDITGKPSTFPPTPHNHPVSEVTGLQGTLDGKQDISAKSVPLGYPTLDALGKVPANQLPDGLTGEWDDIFNKPATFPPEPHSHPVAEISDSGSTGQQLVKSGTAQDARTIIGAIGVDDNARVSVDKDGTLIGVRRGLNFIPGSNITMTLVDDPAGEEVDITINAAAGPVAAARYFVTEIKPAAPFDNDIWFDAATGLIFTYYNDGTSSQWIESVPFLNTMPGTFVKIDFPSSPTDNQTYNPHPGATWKWSASRGVWFAVTTVSDSYTKLEADSNFVDITGDTMGGPLNVQYPPTANQHATSKLYVNEQDAFKVSKNGDIMSGALTLPNGSVSAPALNFSGGVNYGFYWVANQVCVTVNGTLRVVFGADPTFYSNSLNVNSAAGYAHLNLSPSAAAQQAVVNFSQSGVGKWQIGKQTTDDLIIYDIAGGNYLFSSPSGGTTVTFGKNILLPADATNALGAATKQQVDARVLKSGDTMTGNLLINMGNAGNIGPRIQLVNTGGSLNDGASIEFWDGTLRSIYTHSVDRGPYGADHIFTSGNTTQIELFRLRTDQIASGAVVATAAQYAGNTPGKLLTTDAVWAAAAPSNVGSGASLVLNFATSSDFYWSLPGAGCTLSNPTNVKDGQKGIIYLAMGGSGCTITTWGSMWKFPGGTKPTLSAAGSFDAISYAVLNSGFIACTFVADFK